MRHVPWSMMLVALLVASAVPASAAEPASERYTGSAALYLTPQCGCDCPAEGSGGACFAVPAGASRVDLTVVDDLAPAVGVHAVLLDADGATLEEDLYCNEGSLGVPTGAATLVVYVLDPALGGAVCVLQDGTPAAATTGTITAAFA